LCRATAEAGSATICGSVTAVEPLGHGDCVHVELGGPAGPAVVAARTARDAGWRVGDRVNVEFDSSRLQMFDEETGENLAWGSR
jgi:hypothetical protein